VHRPHLLFRTTTGGDERKALLQITERCNLHCAHCFVSPTRHDGRLAARCRRRRVTPGSANAPTPRRRRTPCRNCPCCGVGMMKAA
jgi:hypothetical protein